MGITLIRLRNGAVLAGAMTALLLVSGCRIEKTRHGDGKDVNIETPFGGLSVKTDGKDAQAAIGLDVYPGATPEKKANDDDHAADVNMSFGSFHLGVKAASYTTPDAPAKVMTFYRKQLGRYGTVIECRNHQPVGSPSTTGSGLTCNEGDNGKVHVGNGDEGLELKAGSREHQHIVGLDPQGSGTKFGLVMLDLPHDPTHAGSDSDSKQ